MDEQKILEWLVLQQVKGLGLKRLHQLLDKGHSSTSLLTLSQDELNTLPASIKQDLSALQSQAETHPYFQQARDIQERSLLEGWDIIDITNQNYPTLLKQIPFAPPLIYIKGQKEALFSKQLAVVGARKASQMALNISYQWSKDMAEQDVTITSGLAVGIDGSAHQGALDGSGKTIAVLAHGLDQVYPRCHQKLADSIIEHGALVTEFAPGIAVRRDHFPRRNRIISGLSSGVLVIEAAVKSGSLITAQYALEQNRDVFAMPGSIANPMAKGCHLLIKQGAQLTESSEDIMEYFQPCVAQQSLFTEPSRKKIDPVLAKLLACIPYDFTHFDELLSLTGQSASELNRGLLELEVMSCIENTSSSFRRIT